MIVQNIARKIFGTQNERELKSIAPLVARINSLEPSMKALSDEQLQAKTTEFKQRLAQGETLDQLLPEAFAVVREAAWRVIGQRHYDVQLIGGITLHRGRIAEMRTGEGKTLVATLPTYLNALSGKGVHVITVNDYLARRDSAWMGRIYGFLGLSTGIIVHGLSDAQRKRNYGCDITYGTNNEFGFDYLRDNMKFRLEDYVQRELNFAIVDEVDSILIDEARTPLIISGPTDQSSDLYYAIDGKVREGGGLVKEVDYTVDEKSRTAALTPEGIDKMEKRLGIENLYDPRNIETLHHLNQALRAHVLFHRDVDYVVKDGEVMIVDEFTGRLMPGRRWSDGLHQAIEAKEGVQIENENQTLATITFQNYFRMYNKLGGMTGTADTEAYEFQEIYGLETVVIPPNRKSQRDDQLDRVYKTAQEKYTAAIEDIRACHERGQPVLVGTSSIENSELISDLLTRAKLEHQVLNAKQHAREADIVAQAGRPGMITIATNMAGRGTDIVLGGNVEKQVQAVEADGALGEAERQARVAELRAQWQRDHEAVKAAGGLRIIATERHESRRIDNQLRGRSGRQGDPGSSRFYLSLDDPLMRIFAGDRVRAIMDRLKMPEGEAIEAGIVTRSIESAQRKVEARNFDIRKQLLEYDDVSNDQRKVIYQQRNDILDASDLSAQIASLRAGCFTDLVRQYVPAESMEEQWDLQGLQNALAQEWQIDVPLVQTVQSATAITDEDILELVLKAADQAFQVKLDLVGAEQFTPFMRTVLLQNIDSHWREHLAALDYLRQGIHLRGYAQKQPKQEYKREAFELFAMLLDLVRNEVTRLLMTVQIQSQAQIDAVAQDIEARAEAISNVSYTAPTESGEAETTMDLRTLATQMPQVGRNEPCPCGSGKKFKFCHGQLS